MPPESNSLSWEFLLPRHWTEWSLPPIDLRDLTDIWVLGIVSISIMLLLWALFRTAQAWWRVGKYARLAKRLKTGEALTASRSEWSQKKGFPLALEFNDMLVEVPRLGDPLEKDLKRCGSASEIFNKNSLGQGIIGNRLLLAAPAILTGLGVLGTFVGLAMGIGGLNLDASNIEDLDKSISPLIKGSSTAFVTSVWGVACSIAFTLIEKILEWFAVGRIRGVQLRFDSLVPRYTAEESMIALHQSSSQSEKMLKGLAIAIGEEMQKAMNRLGSSITDAVKDALGGQAEDLGKMSADLMSEALTIELANLKQAVTGMSDGFKEEFGEASKQLSATISGFDTVLSGVDESVKSSQAAMSQAVERLTAHEEVVEGLEEGATRLKEAATELTSMRDTFTLSAEKNAEAATAQEKAAAKNELVSGKLETIGEKLPEVQEAIASGAQVIASLGQPLLDLKELLGQTPEIFEQQAVEQASRDEKRSSLLLEQTTELAKTIADAAAEFSKIETLSTSLSTSSANLETAGAALGKLAQSIGSASEQHASAAKASEKAALAGERTAEKLEPLPQSLAGLSETLTTAGGKVKEGADAAKEVYSHLIVHQKQWFEGIQTGLEAMKDRVQEILAQYGESVEGNTRDHMEQWTKAVTESLSGFAVQVQTLEGAIDDLTSEMNQ